jgi:hypothetical protein
MVGRSTQKRLGVVTRRGNTVRSVRDWFASTCSSAAADKGKGGTGGLPPYGTHSAAKMHLLRHYTVQKVNVPLK